MDQDNQDNKVVTDGGKAITANGESMFIKHEKPVLKGKDDTMAGIFARDVRFHSDTPNEYEEGSEQEQVGTIVPVSDREGGIKEKPNKYGQVVVGSRIGKESSEPLDVSVLEANETALIPLVQATPPEEPVAPAKPVDKTVELQVVFTGMFGSFKGIYKTVFEQNGMVIAVYDLSEPVYTPPISAESFRIKTADIDCQVTHIGIHFETEFFNCGFQIFVIKE